MRTPFQGVVNIVRFNRHFYILTCIFLLLLFLLKNYIHDPFRFYLYFISVLVICVIFISLAISYYIYDISALYTLDWFDVLKTENKILNIHAGFDETSFLLKNKFKNAELIVLDFYDPVKHTEISIKRAREAYPPYPDTQEVSTDNLKLADNFADKIMVMLSAHEIRNEDERIVFFRELKRVLKPSGQLFIIEHLRDPANFMAYNIGFFHFHSRATWLKTFKSATLKMKSEIKLTPFVSIFILEKNGITF